MAADGPRSLVTSLLFLNLLMYATVSVIAGLSLNYGIDETPSSVVGLSVPARLFPIYYPIGNLATGFFVVFSLIASLVGIATSLTGLQSALRWNVPNLLSAAAYSIFAWSLTLLAMGLACKEISISWRPARLRALEGLTITLSGTQLLCIGAIHAGVTAAKKNYHTGRGA